MFTMGRSSYVLPATAEAAAAEEALPSQPGLPALPVLPAQLCPVDLVHYLVGLGLLPQWVIGLLQEALLIRRGPLPQPGQPLQCGTLTQCINIPQPGQPLQCGTLLHCVLGTQLVCVQSGGDGGGDPSGSDTVSDARDALRYFLLFLYILVLIYVEQLHRG